jgi:hypothetical protein
MSYHKNILIYDNQIDGHHLEYIHHLYKGAQSRTEFNFIFVIPESFLKIKNQLEWKQVDNIQFVFIKEKDIYLNENIFLRSYKISKYVKSVAKVNNVSDVFFITLMTLLPSIIFFFNSKIKVSGIIYQIYLYRWSKASIFIKLQDIFKYIILTKSTFFKSLFILNDSGSADYLNKIFKTTRFKYLPDPFIPLPTNKLQNLRNKLQIPHNKKIILHFGAIAERKGSLNILKSINSLSENDLLNFTFIFAGRVDNNIKDEFYKIYSQIKKKTQVFVFDEFCEYEFISSLCFTCDFILIPYLVTANSSGVLGYAAQFNKPVVAPRNGLLGKLIKKYKLGVLLSSSSIKSIKSFLLSINDHNIDVKSYYLEGRTVSNFNNKIFEQFHV